MRSDFDVIASLDLDPVQVERFLGPISEIIAAARRGLAHSVVAIEINGQLIGFYVIHPAPTDSSCWWLGWFALERGQQGHGYGTAALTRILQHLATIPGCRRVRLLVGTDNLRAQHLYHKAGFRDVGRAVATDEIILELGLPAHVTARELTECTVYAAAARARRVFRHRRLRLTVGPHPAWVIGVERGPPALAA
jgi:GNAT superfamily N-acetyltransferase